ncbi:hypothetical protein IWQ62_006099 [Dispira parvispora]|uniref:Uncharacterized protein n=1 Tax=Dispira parvispora TaxID=1520584 RepID=A0A9W8APR6_9FUNG|nr:hypothetical protein IWQ62_006099 [Dispira parvispora]
MWGKIFILQFLTAAGWGLPLPAPPSGSLVDLSCIFGCPQQANPSNHNIGSVTASPKSAVEDESKLSEQVNAPLTTPTTTSALAPTTVNESNENVDTNLDDSSTSDDSSSSSSSDSDDNKTNEDTVVEPGTDLAARSLKTRVLRRRQVKRRGDYRSLTLQTFPNVRHLL